MYVRVCVCVCVCTYKGMLVRNDDMKKYIYIVQCCVTQKFSLGFFMSSLRTGILQ